MCRRCRGRRKKQKTKDKRQKAKGKSQKAKGKRQKAKSKKQKAKKAKDKRQKAKSKRQKTKGKKQKAKEKRQKAKGKKQKAKGKRQKAKGKRQKTKSKKQKAKGKRQKAKGKKQKAKGNMQKAEIIQSGNFEDARGRLTFFNDFDMKEVRRCYVIEHHDNTIVRAWQGHKQEQKWFYVIAGSFKVVLVKPDDWENPSIKLKADGFLLSFAEPKVLHVPGGFANGFKALEPKSRIMVFSSFTVQESAEDNYRFDPNRWYDWK